MFILNIVNSIIGKKGNIGLRTSHIIDALENNNIDQVSISRGVDKKYNNNNKNMGVLGLLPRLLNAYRIYLNPNYNNRILDIKLFSYYAIRVISKVKSEHRICHIWESSPQIIEHYKKLGFITILDVPIAPSSYAVTTFQYYNESINIDYSYNILQEEKCFHLADYIISPSEFVTQTLTDLNINKNKIFTIPFGVNINQSQKKIFTKDYHKQGIDYCFAGSINKRKGIEFLLQAWNDERFNNDRLHLCVK